MAKIMLVEDDNNLREIYGARLGAEGHTIVSAKDGEEALALAVKEKPELIISDVMMPRISGFDMLDILRNAPETKNTKIIMMTALSQAEDKARADKLGADLYLVKSQVTLEDVAKAVDQVLSGGSQQSSNEAVQAEKPAETSTPAPATPPAESAPVEVASPQPAVEPVKEEVLAATPEDQPEGTSPPPAPTEVSEASQPTPPPQTPVVQSETPASEPAPAAPVAAEKPQASAPKKIEITEAPEAPAAKAEEATEKEAPAATPIEVVLPDTPNEDKPEDAEAEKTEAPQPAEEPAATAQTVPASPASDEGPNLDEVLAEEAKTAGSDEKAAAPEPAPAPAEPAAPAKEEAKPVESTEASPLDNNSTKKKVIEPINDLNKKPDLDALLAKEEATEAVSAPPANTVVSPDNKTASQPAVNPSNPAEEPPKSPPDDFSKVAL